jgi:predicted nucleotidyltransferase
MFGLPEKTIQQLQNFFAKQDALEQVKIYGSRALGTYEKTSDIDLAIFVKEGEDVAAHIKTELEELPTPYLFDVTDYKQITNENLKEHIDKYGKLFYRQGEDNHDQRRTTSS